MKVVYKEPGKDAEIRDIKNELEELQSLVDGWIEHMSFVDGVGLIMNEEGRLRNMKPNFRYGWGTVLGSAIFVGETDEDFTDITDEGIEKVMKFLQYHAF